MPLGYLLIKAAEGDAAEVAELVLRRRSFELLLNTLWLMLGVLALVTALGLPAAWLTTRCRLPARRVWTVLLVLPLSIPGYLMAFTMLAAGGPYGSSARLLGVRLPILSGLPGALIALGLYLFPYMFLTLRAALLSLDVSLEEAARSLGAGRWRVFLRVILPQMLPGWLAGALLVALHVIGDFGAVSLMRYETFSLALYQQYSGSFERTYAAWLALMLLGISGVLMAGEWLAMRRVRLNRAGRSVRRHPPLRPLGLLKLPALALVSLIVAAGVVLPVGTIVFWWQQSSGGEFAADVWPALWNSMRASLPAALITTALALPIAFLAIRYPTWLSSILERTAYLGYAVPPLAFGLGLVFFSLQVAPVLYQSMTLLVWAYAVHFLAEALGPLRSAVMTADHRLEEASHSLGVGRWGTLRRVTFPLVRPGVAVGLVFVFLSCMKELPLTVLLSPIGFETLAYNVWDFTNEALYAEAAPHALALVVVGSLFVAVMLVFRREEP